MKRALVGIFLLVLLPSLAQAQLMSNNFRGDFGVLAGVVPPPGWYLAGGHVGFDTDTLRNNDGDRVILDTSGKGEASASGWAFGFWKVTNIKIWGGDYSFQAFPAINNNTFEVPILGLKGKTKSGFTDLYFQPFNLGWHTDWADYTAGFGMVAPTGSYDVDADDNLGLGQWSVEPFAGATWYFDEDRKWHFSTIAYYEIHSKKKGTDIRVGDIFTIEGGLGRSWLNGMLTVGISFNAQWKVTEDKAGPYQPVFDELGIGRHQVYSLGVEVTLPIATENSFIGSVTARYMHDGSARNTIEGETIAILAAFPIPSIPLK